MLQLRLVVVRQQGQVAQGHQLVQQQQQRQRRCQQRLKVRRQRSVEWEQQQKQERQGQLHRAAKQAHQSRCATCWSG